MPGLDQERGLFEVEKASGRVRGGFKVKNIGFIYIIICIIASIVMILIKSIFFWFFVITGLTVFIVWAIGRQIDNQFTNYVGKE